MQDLYNLTPKNLRVENCVITRAEAMLNGITDPAQTAGGALISLEDSYHVAQHQDTGHAASTVRRQSERPVS